MKRQIKEFVSLTEVLDDMDALGIQGVQRYRAMNQYLSLKARYEDVPISGSFELTPLCNLDCKMCYVHLNANQIGTGERLLTIDEWKKIIKEAVDAGMMYATLTGGECLTYPGFAEIYLYIRSLGIQPDIMTNGRLLTKEMVSFLTKNPPGVMQLSLYGSSEDAYEKVTGHRAFEQVIEGIKRAKKAGLNLVLSVTPNRYMQDDIPELLNLLYSLNVPYVIGSSTLPARLETEREMREFAIEMDAYFLIQKLNAEHCKALPERAPARNVPRYIPLMKAKLKGLPCGGAHSSFHVNWKGEICPCIAFEPAVHCSMLDKHFIEAWRIIQKAMLEYKPPSECNSCDVRDYCATCPGEKCMSQLNGSLNVRVCEKLRRNIAEGNIVVEKHDLCDR